MFSNQDPIAVLSVSLGRRLMITGILGTLGLMLVLLALRLEAPGTLTLAFLLCAGALALYLTARVYSATGHALLLTREGLFASSGMQIAALDNIASVDRGFLAFKPSNGFVLRLKSPAPGGWAPGLWWRYGTRLGVGGATNGKAARAMADAIAMLQATPAAPIAANTPD